MLSCGLVGLLCVGPAIHWLLFPEIVGISSSTPTNLSAGSVVMENGKKDGNLRQPHQPIGSAAVEQMILKQCKKNFEGRSSTKIMHTSS